MQFLTSSACVQQPVLGREHPGPQQLRKERQEGPKADCKSPEQQKPKLTQLTQQNWTTAVLPRTLLLKRTLLTSLKRWLQFYLKHDADGMEYSHWSTCMSVKVCPSMPPFQDAPHLADRKPQNTLFSLVMVKRSSVSSYSSFWT